MTRTRFTLAIGSAALALICLSSAYAAHSAAKIGQPAPDFSLKDQDGNAVKLSDFAGRIVVLEWTNPGCPFVQRHYREHTMTSLASQYKDRGVAWLAIDSTGSDSLAKDKAWSEQNHLPYPVLNDAKGQAAREYGAKSTPHLFIINRDGRLAYMGGIDDDPNGEKPTRINYVKRALDEILRGEPVSIPVTKSYGCGVHYEE